MNQADPDTLPSHHYTNWRRQMDSQALWWQQHPPDRPIVRLIQNLHPDRTPTWDPWCFTRRPDEPEKHFAALAREWQLLRCHVDALPAAAPNFAAGMIAPLIHDYLEMGEQTAWVEKPCQWRELENIEFREDHPWWRHMIRTVTAALDAGFVTSTPDIGGVYDIAAAVRGTQNLLFDLIDSPQRVKQLAEQIRRLWLECFDRLYKPVAEACGGIVNRWGFFAKGRHIPLQCDFAAMLSPAMFEEFILPDLLATADHLDYAVYHLDGPGQIAHLDLLLSAPRIRAIQWVPGDGQPSLTDPKWFDMYKKVQAAGRGLVLGGDFEALDLFLNELDPALLQLSIGANSDREVDATKERLAKL